MPACGMRCGTSAAQSHPQPSASSCCRTSVSSTSMLHPPHVMRYQRPFTAAPRPRPCSARQPHLRCRAASADGWWRDGEQHWTFVHSEQELQEVVDQAPNLVLVDCYTPWCGGCKMISPTLTRMAMEADLKKQCVFVKLDTDEMKDWASRESIKTLPYLGFYRAGEGRLVGMQMTPARVKLVRKAIATLAENRGKSFRLDPNGYVVPVEPVAA